MCSDSPNPAPTQPYASYYSGTGLPYVATSPDYLNGYSGDLSKLPGMFNPAGIKLAIADVPDKGVDALVYGACYCIVDSMLNRVGQSPTLHHQYSKESNVAEQLKSLRQQKKDYLADFDSELLNLSE